MLLSKLSRCKQNLRKRPKKHYTSRISSGAPNLFLKWVSWHLWTKTKVGPEFLDEKITANEAIEADKAVTEIRVEPYSLPDGFQWDTLNLDEPLVLKELYTLLNENYVEDDDCMFRFDYQPDFLKW